MSPVLIVCAKRYNGHELWTLLGTLVERGHAFEVVSQDLVIKDEKTHEGHIINRTLWDVTPGEVGDYGALVIVSGNPDDTESMWEDTHIHNLLWAARKADLPIGAICMAVPILAPVCEGVKVSPFPVLRAKQRLKDHGALLQNLTISIDKRTVTAENQFCTVMWAEEICNMVEGKPPEVQLVESGFDPKGLERMMMPEVREAIDEARGYKMVMRKDQDKK